MEQKDSGSQCVRRKNIGSLSFRKRSLSLRKTDLKGINQVPFFHA